MTVGQIPVAESDKNNDGFVKTVWNVAATVFNVESQNLGFLTLFLAFVYCLFYIRRSKSVTIWNGRNVNAHKTE